MSNPEYWALIITINMASIALAIGSHMNTKNITPPRWIAAPWELLVLIMEKPFRRKKAVYEPAGIVHRVESPFGDYYAHSTGHGTYRIWHNNEYQGEHRLPIDLNETTIITHPKDQK